MVEHYGTSLESQSVWLDAFLHTPSFVISINERSNLSLIYIVPYFACIYLQSMSYILGYCMYCFASIYLHCMSCIYLHCLNCLSLAYSMLSLPLLMHALFSLFVHLLPCSLVLLPLNLFVPC